MLQTTALRDGMRKRLIFGGIQRTHSRLRIPECDGHVEDPSLRMYTGRQAVMNPVHSSTVKARSQSLHIIGDFIVATLQADEGSLKAPKVSSSNGPLSPIAGVGRREPVKIGFRVELQAFLSRRRRKRGVAKW